ncbi:MAG: hypothetical protein AAF558_10655 [Verrucomicrobiota bacterium]
MKKEDQLQQLLKLKQRETPGEAYFDAFVDEFHRYQRTSVLQTRKSWIARWRRALSELAEDFFATPSFAMQSGFAATAVVVLTTVLVFWGELNPGTSNQGSMAMTPSSESYVYGPKSLEDAAGSPAELNMAHLTSFDRDFENSSYVTGESTLAYDSVLAF